MRILFLLLWILSVFGAVIWTNENPDKIQVIKSSLKKKYTKPEYNFVNENTNETDIVDANSYKISLKKIISLKGKTSFVLSNIKNKGKFNKDKISIYTQSGFRINNQELIKLNLNKRFHLEQNGGVKSIITVDGKEYSFMSSKNGKCYYASINNNQTSEEIFKSECLPFQRKKFDFNGLGSSFVINNDYIFLTLGTPTRNSDEISKLAQKNNSYFGKILRIKKTDFNNNKIVPTVYSSGHRTPQGITKLNNKVFSVEHGPKGGDELNLITNGKNYGWPLVSYGTKYFYDNEGKSYNLNHKINGFEEPIFAFIPSIGISALNTCPEKLKNYYKKNCLLALSLYGNELREGKSIIIFLLNEDLNQIHSMEKVFLGSQYPLRHFMTNEKNELYEDSEGNIYISVDNDGIYEVSFFDFR